MWMFIKYKVRNVSVMHLKRHVFHTFYEAVLDFMKLQCFLGRKRTRLECRITTVDTFW